MSILIAALLISNTALAYTVCEDVVVYKPEKVTICRDGDAYRFAPAPAKKEPSKPAKKVRRKPVTAKPVEPAPVVVVVVEDKPSKDPFVQELSPKKNPDEGPSLVISPRVALGGTIVERPKGEALVGVRLWAPRLNLGVEAYSSFSYGFGIQGLVYAYRAKDFDWHLNAGVLGLGKNLISVSDVPRDWDLTVGTGVEYKVAKFLVLTADYRWSIPDPLYVSDHNQPVLDANGTQVYGQAGRYLDTGNVVGNSLTQGHFLFGVMVRL